MKISRQVSIGDSAPLLIIAGPCVIETHETCRRIADTMLNYCNQLGLNYVFKASYDKANRTSITSYRGPGRKRGLEILSAVAEEFKIPVLTDIHHPEEAAEAAKAVDILQIPAFLCRQTDLLLAAASTGKVVNVKKGQFLAPGDMLRVKEKINSSDNQRVIMTERGTSFGYSNLVVDMRGLVIMRELGVPVIFDATHSVQLPGGQGSTSGGQREFVYPLSRAAAAVGIDGLFLEVHPEPEKALSDGANSLPLEQVSELMKKVKEIHELANTENG